MGPGCIGKSNTNNLPGPTDLNENSYLKKKLFFKDATQKSASMVAPGIAIEVQPWSPIFEKCPHLRDKGGVLTLRTPVGFALTPTVRSLISGKSFLLTHCPQICVRKEISRPGFPDVNRYSVVHSIDLRRVFLRYLGT